MKNRIRKSRRIPALNASPRRVKRTIERMKNGRYQPKMSASQVQRTADIIHKAYFGGENE